MDGAVELEGFEFGKRQVAADGGQEPVRFDGVDVEVRVERIEFGKRRAAADDGGAEVAVGSVAFGRGVGAALGAVGRIAPAQSAALEDERAV